MNEYDVDDESDEYEDDTIVGEKSSDQQILDEINEVIEEYRNNIRDQAASIQPTLYQNDYIEDFIKKELAIDDIESVNDLSIMINPDLTQFDKMKLDYFVNYINAIFNETFGIFLREPDISLCYGLYKVFITELSNYFLNYIVGLQKLSSDYSEGIPNYNELNIKYFMKLEKVEKINYKVVSDYIYYIAEQGIIPEYYFEITLLGSPGNELLSKLYLEHTNDRVSFDFEFFLLKISKILSTSEEIQTNVVSRLIDIFDETGNLN